MTYMVRWRCTHATLEACSSKVGVSGRRSAPMDAGHLPMYLVAMVTATPCSSTSHKCFECRHSEDISTFDFVTTDSEAFYLISNSRLLLSAAVIFLF